MLTCVWSLTLPLILNLLCIFTLNFAGIKPLNLTSQVTLIFTLTSTIQFTNSLTLTLTNISSGTFNEICTDLASYLDLDFELEVQYHLTHDLDRYFDLALHLKLRAMFNLTLY